MNQLTVKIFRLPARRSFLGILFSSTVFFLISCQKSNAETAASKISGTYRGIFMPGSNVTNRIQNYVVKVRALSQGRVRISAESTPDFGTFETGVMLANGTVTATQVNSIFYYEAANRLDINILAGSFTGEKQ